MLHAAALTAVSAACAAAPAPPAPTPPPGSRVVTRSNVAATRDDTGGVLNAHETEIVQWEPGGTYYMYAMKYALCHGGPTNKYGCSANRSDCDFRKDHNVSVFTSSDMSPGSWHWEADILPGGIPPAAYFRGKVLRNRREGSYVLWIFGGGRIVVARSAAAAGPFALVSVRESDEVLLHKTGDFSFFVDADDTAYLAYNANMKGASIEQLAPDYLSSLGPTGAQFTTGVFGSEQTEAPVLFERGGVYYALFDRTCCVCSYGSGVGVYTADSPLGKYTYRGQVGRDAKGDPVTHAQQCWVMHIPGADPEYVWVGDRWGSAADGLHGHDMTYWQPLRFDADGGIAQFEWVDTVNLTLPAA